MAEKPSVAGSTARLVVAHAPHNRSCTQLLVGTLSTTSCSGSVVAVAPPLSIFSSICDQSRVGLSGHPTTQWPVNICEVSAPDSAPPESRAKERERHPGESPVAPVSAVVHLVILMHFAVYTCPARLVSVVLVVLQVHLVVDRVSNQEQLELCQQYVEKERV